MWNQHHSTDTQENPGAFIVLVFLVLKPKADRFHCQLCSAFLYLEEKKKRGIEETILRNKFRL